MKTLVVLLTSVFLVQACGSANKKSRSDGDGSVSADAEKTGSDAPAGVETSIRLLDASGLAVKLESTVGSNKSSNASNPSENLFETYISNFGTREGLSFGDLGADKMNESNLMVNYMLALNIVAYNAALLCEAGGKKGLCDCSSADKSEGLLRRIAPYLSFSGAAEKELASEFANLCGQDYVRAMAASLSSVAFAKRN